MMHGRETRVSCANFEQQGTTKPPHLRSLCPCLGIMAMLWLGTASLNANAHQ